MEISVTLEILKIPEEDFRLLLYDEFEQWEELRSLSGLYQHEEIRGWWKLQASRICEQFAERLTVNIDGQIWLRRIEGVTDMTDEASRIRQAFIRYMRKHLGMVPFNHAVIELVL